MISVRKRTYLLSMVLAVPPAMVAGLLCSKVLPQPDNVPAVVGANDPEVGALLQPGASQPPSLRLAKSLH